LEKVKKNKIFFKKVKLFADFYTIILMRGDLLP